MDDGTLLAERPITRRARMGNSNFKTTVTTVQNGPIEAFLLGPRMDIFMIGGASILVCLAYWMFVDSAAPTTNVAFLAFALAFLVNSPHFASSYQLMYGEYGSLILKKKSFFWAAVISPILIIGTITFGIATANREVLAFLAQTMYLSVGWHYVKQIYGVSLVASTVQKRYFGTWEKNFILLNLYSVWAMSWVSSNLDSTKNDLDGIAYFSLGLPQYLMTIAYAATAITLIATIVIMVRKYIRTGARPAYSSMVGFATIYFWYIPALNHPSFFYMIPFFHSLQYMLFIFTMKRNHAETESANQDSEPLRRQVFMRKLWGFLGLAVVLGALGFEFVPKNLDQYFPMTGPLNNATLWYFAIALFINLHHYFIDNVIWRGDNEYVKRNLVQANQQKVRA